MNDNYYIFKEDISKKWNPNLFSIVREPILISELENKEVFSQPVKSILDMPIKLAGKEDIVLPFTNLALEEILSKCLEFEKEINPNWKDYYIYLTIDQREVTKGFSQRINGAHFDGMQGIKYKDKLPVCHQYIISDVFPTEFYVQSFDASNLDENKHNWFVELSKQIKEDSKYIAKPYEIYFMDAYVIHNSPIATYDAIRTFYRIEFSLKTFNRKGNTENPLLPTGWRYELQPIPEHLRVAPLVDTGWK